MRLASPLGMHIPCLNLTSLSKFTPGVRGNHDQKIVEWRSWFNWVRSFPDGQDWIDNYEDEIPDTVTANSDLWSKTIIASKKPGSRRFPFPDDWKWASEHWRVARDMTDEQYRYLLSLPLVLHVTSLHVMIVHGGILPVDPTRPVTSSHQPLSRIPVLTKSSKASENEMRTAQEVAVVTEM